MDMILKSLYDSFYTPLPMPEEEQEIKTAYEALRHKLEKQERKLVLQIIDAKDAVADALSLDSFICGFHLAMQLAVELNTYIENRHPGQIESTDADICTPNATE